MSATGFWLMSRWGFESLHDPSANIALVICGFGFGLALAPVNAAVLASTDPDVHGLASAHWSSCPGWSGCWSASPR